MADEQNITISKNLKKAVSKNDLGVLELGNKLGFGKNTISTYCNKPIPDNIKNFLVLSRELGIDVDYLIDGKMKKESQTRYEPIIKLLNNLSDRELIKIEGVIENYIDKFNKPLETSSISSNTG